jgi:tetratricopeptide (TPR) repeat protein
MTATDHLIAAAQALQDAGRYAEAAAAYRQVPMQAVSARTIVQLGVCLTRAGVLDEARGHLTAAASQVPDHPLIKSALAELGAALLAEGRYADGWPLIENRVGLRPDLIPPCAASYPEWRGEPLDGKSILVWVEQGLGDQIMFARFASQLADRGARVTLCCNPLLTTLFGSLRGVDAVIPIPIGGSVRVPHHDVWTRYFSIPGQLGITLETLPAAHYLRAPVREIASQTPGGRLGIFWKPSQTGATAAAKTLPDPLARELLELGGVSLHPEDTGAHDFAETAAIVDRLDLVITVDTAVAHLAGAMGKPVWTLLPHRADWRWLKDREDSPWYPSARLFRQPAPGDWGSVVSQVREALAA